MSENRCKGTVKFCTRGRDTGHGYGFIYLDEGKDIPIEKRPEIFFHASKVAWSDEDEDRYLYSGDVVEFDLEDGEYDRQNAINIVRIKEQRSRRNKTGIPSSYVAVSVRVSDLDTLKESLGDLTDDSNAKNFSHEESRVLKDLYKSVCVAHDRFISKNNKDKDTLPKSYAEVADSM